MVSSSLVYLLPIFIAILCPVLLMNLVFLLFDGALTTNDLTVFFFFKQKTAYEI